MEILPKSDLMEPVSKVTVEVANISSGQSCNLTLRCFAASGNNQSFHWTPGNHTQLEWISDQDAHLQQLVELSNRINYTCTVQNPISWKIANISRKHVYERHTDERRQGGEGHRAGTSND
ncbi:uncharacterized protein [Narcine bancroftii]|uniref:uncharacterized protein isoform X3 n=1 Tax=Narcine bancroftii TaxID=1343680 RepID=UPI00383112FB